MSTVTKVARNFQITVPKNIRESWSLKIGDVVSFEIKNGQTILSPLAMVPKRQAYYWTDKTQSELKHAESELKKKKLKTFKTLHDLKKNFGDQ